MGRLVGASLAAVGVLFAAIALGHQLGTSSKDGALAEYAAQLDEARRSADQRQAELAALRADLERSRSSATEEEARRTSGATIGCPSTFDSIFDDGSTPPFLPASVCVIEGRSYTAGGVTISIVAIEFGGDPPRNRVDAVIEQEGERPLRLRSADVGWSRTYGSRRYRLSAVDAVSATFTAK